VKRPQGFDPPSKPVGPPARISSQAKPRADRTEDPTRRERAELKKLEFERRSYEKLEVRRFTRRARRRRQIVAATVAIALTFILIISVAVFSPILALRAITVTGASRLDPAAISAALSDQLGKPLALVDYDEITRKLADFPLIRSYTTESQLPSTLVVAIVERVPIGSVSDGITFHLVDPAGIVVESRAARLPGLPVIEVSSASAKDPAFHSVVEVLLSLPADLLARVDEISATTNDDVSFVLTGVGQSVIWGSADRSTYKARVLAALIASQDQSAQLEYDVSAPDNVVVRQRVASQ
jgi:cell division protein FtsQ